MMCNKKIKNVTFVKSGTGHFTPRISIPIEWVRDMQLDEKNKKVELEYDSTLKEVKIRKVTE